MSTGRRRSALSYIPGLKNNTVLQLIIASGVAYVMLGLCWAVIKLVYDGDDANFNHYFIPNIALPALSAFKSHWWTLFTYGWFHFSGFWELFTNMVWLYCFGSVVQMLVGPRQVIPLYAYCLVAGGVFYLLSQLLPGEFRKIPPVIGLLGSRAGLIGLAAAAFTLTPKYRFYFTETFSVPMIVVAGIFVVLMIMGSGFYLPVILLLAGGGIMGYVYIRLLQAGYRPGEWMYTLSHRVESLVTPDENAERKKQNKQRHDILKRIYEPQNGISQKRIDDILDKINQKGYNALSSEEKEILMRAGKE